MTKVIEFPADKISKGVHSFTPEMGQRKVNCQMEVSIGHYGGYYIRTKIDLKGRGITFIDVHNGVNRYKVTELVYEKLKAEYSISSERLLD